MFELEGRGMPVAYVDTEGRIPQVQRRKSAFEKTFEKFGFHRALRLAGARPGDRVRVGALELELWDYPKPKLAGTSDGIRGYRYIENRPSRSSTPHRSRNARASWRRA